MALDTLYGRFVRQKPGVGAQVDWSHPLAQGLVFAWILNEGSGVAMNLCDRVTSKPEGNATWKSHPRGYAINIPQAGGNRLIQANPLRLPNTNSVFTMVAAGQLASLVTTRNTLFGMGSEATALGVNIQWESGTHVGAYKASSGPILVEYTTTIDTNYHVFAYTQDPAATPAKIFYVDGLQVATNSAGTETAVVDKVLIGENVNEAAPQNWDGDILYALVYSKVLSPSLVSWLFLEPYSFMLAPSQRRWVTAGQPFAPWFWIFVHDSSRVWDAPETGIGWLEPPQLRAWQSSLSRHDWPVAFSATTFPQAGRGVSWQPPQPSRTWIADGGTP